MHEEGGGQKQNETGWGKGIGHLDWDAWVTFYERQQPAFSCVYVEDEEEAVKSVSSSEVVLLEQPWGEL